MDKIHIFNGLKGDSKIPEVLKDNPVAEIKGVFNSSFNILAKHNLLTIIDFSWGYIPLGISVNIKNYNFKSIGIRSDTEVRLLPEKIIIGNKLKIDLKECLWQKSKIKIKKIDESLLYKNLNYVKGTLRGKKTNYGLIQLLDYTSLLTTDGDDNIGSTPDQLSGRVIKIFKQFFKILINGSKEEAIKNLESIIGLGIGTTPSGDDLLLGIITTFNYLNYLKPQDYPSGFKDMIRKKTTLISQKYIVEAIEGNISERLSNYMEALLYDDSDRVLPKTVLDLIEVGSSSGKEIILGTILAVEYYLKGSVTKSV